MLRHIYSRTRPLSAKLGAVSCRALALEASDIAIVKSTIPFLEANGTKLTELFYQKLLNNHPELLSVFPSKHQADGRQPKALAGAVLAYAKHIDNLDAIAGALPVIIEKHVAFKVTAPQYDVVGSTLLEALEELVGSDGTEHIIKAWGNAYGVLANVLIEAEANAAKNKGKLEGGWEGLRDLRIKKVQKESEDAVSIYFEPKEGVVSLHTPGQYLTLEVQVGDKKTMRNYSISSVPSKNEYRITVKKEGLVSTYLHGLKEGSIVQAIPPCGDFNLFEAPSKNVVFIAGGIGITPFISMVDKVVKDPKVEKVTFVHCIKNDDFSTFKNYLEDVAKNNSKFTFKVWNTEKNGLITGDEIKKLQKDGETTDVYSVGPQGLMALAKQNIKDGNRFKYEFFGPLQAI